MKSITSIPLFILFGFVGSMVISLFYFSLPAFEGLGLGVYTTSDWDPSRNHFGGLAAIYGSLVVCSLAVTLALPLVIGSVIFVLEFSPRSMKGLFSTLNDIMASFPTIIFGLWGLYILGPILKSTLFSFLYTYLNFIPLFSTRPLGPSYLLASIVLAIMIIPFASSTVREVYSQIPKGMDESAYALGLGKLYTIRIKLSYVKAGILGGTTLAFGRGIGETVAVALTVGGSANISPSLLSPGYTIPSLIANQFGSAFTPIEQGALFSLSLLLFVIGISFIAVSRLVLIRR